MNLSGATGIISGASSGIGWATSKLLSEAGAKLVVTARRADVLNQLVGELSGDRMIRCDSVKVTTFYHEGPRRT